eukprot:scaffold79061_cov30-Tisochrysis_lutea.AAC.5
MCSAELLRRIKGVDTAAVEQRGLCIFPDSPDANYEGHARPVGRPRPEGVAARLRLPARKVGEVGRADVPEWACGQLAAEPVAGAGEAQREQSHPIPHALVQQRAQRGRLASRRVSATEVGRSPVLPLLLPPVVLLVAARVWRGERPRQPRLVRAQRLAPCAHRRRETEKEEKESQRNPGRHR